MAFYARIFERKRLRPDEYVICADEKSQLQGLGRRHQTVPVGPDARRWSSSNTSAAGRWPTWPRGTSTTNLFDRVEPKTGIEPFGRLVDQVMAVEPDRGVLLERLAQGPDPNDFADLDALSQRLLAFGDYYRQVARPFEWTFTRHDLDRLVARIADRERHLRLAA